MILQFINAVDDVIDSIRENGERIFLTCWFSIMGAGFLFCCYGIYRTWPR